MKRLYFLIFILATLFFVPNIFGHNGITLYQESDETTTTKTYFTDLRGISNNEAPSYNEKSLCTLKGDRYLFGFDYSPQRDTTKKRIPQSDKGSIQQKQKQQITTEIDGLLLNATISSAGYDFYVDFSHNWTPPINAQDYTIVVKEYPGRGANIIVAIEVNGKQLVYRRMRPIYAAVHQLSISAANYLNGYISKGNHLRGVDADGNFIDVQATNETRKIKTPFDVY